MNGEAWKTGEDGGVPVMGDIKLSSIITLSATTTTTTSPVSFPGPCTLSLGRGHGGAGRGGSGADNTPTRHNSGGRRDTDHAIDTVLPRTGTGTGVDWNDAELDWCGLNRGTGTGVDWNDAELDWCGLERETGTGVELERCGTGID
ncbi:hypothetical protein Pmani_038491 [Petrolisthes manimaculis]|uniref:Uncharacterized protein n=1 Tax=Petrolisthes manimaculis TaxID=1843537 RepID=A0AAE1NGT4_9EUCA|nr:hypothetical protein Pmani_038491 [Petrolisthes manimaculis]